MAETPWHCPGTRSKWLHARQPHTPVPAHLGFVGPRPCSRPVPFRADCLAQPPGGRHSGFRGRTNQPGDSLGSVGVPPSAVAHCGAVCGANQLELRDRRLGPQSPPRLRYGGHVGSALPHPNRPARLNPGLDPPAWGSARVSRSRGKRSPKTSTIYATLPLRLAHGDGDHPEFAQNDLRERRYFSVPSCMGWDPHRCLRHRHAWPNLHVAYQRQ